MADRSTHDRTREQLGEGQHRRKRVGFAGRAILLAVGVLAAALAVVRWFVTRPVVVPKQPSPPPAPPTPPPPDAPEPVPAGIVPSIGAILSAAFGEHVTPGAGSDFIVQLGDKRIAVSVHLTFRSTSPPSVASDQAYLRALAYFAPRVGQTAVINGVVMVIGNTQLLDLLPTNPRERMRVVPLLSSTDADAIVAAIRDLAA
jgi:hypothetical protein